MMKLLLKILLWIAAVAMFLVVLAFGCVYLLECIGPGMAAERFKAMTGFSLDIASLKLSLIRASAEIDDARISNPKYWPEDDFLTVNKAIVDIKPLTFVGDKRREFEEVAIDLGPINLVTDSHGKSNAGEFFKGLKTVGEKPAPRKEEGAEKKVEKPPRGFVIRHLVIRASSLRIVDYSAPGSKPAVIAFEFEIEMRDVTDLKEVRKKLLSKFSRSFLWSVMESTQWSTGGC